MKFTRDLSGAVIVDRTNQKSLFKNLFLAEACVRAVEVFPGARACPAVVLALDQLFTVLGPVNIFAVKGVRTSSAKVVDIPKTAFFHSQSNR